MSKIEVNTIDAQCGSTITIGSSGKTVTLAPGASQSGFGRTGTVDWCTTAKTSPFTAVNGKGYFVNTTSGGITVTLPSSPSAGDIIAVADYASTWQNNNLTLCRNSSKINGECTNTSLSTQGASVTLVYVDGTRGWKQVNDGTLNVTGSPAYVAATGGTVITCGDYKTHIFTADGCFAVTSSGQPSGSNKVDYFVVAGGASGGNQFYTGGGGAGGFRLSNEYSTPAPTMSPLSNPTGLTVSVQTYPISVGAGGAGGPSSPGSTGNSGSNSIFSSITSAGGGGGGFETTSAGSGGSGGGENGYGPGSPAPLAGGGAGNTPPVSPPQGNNGGIGMGPSGSPHPHIGGGGGGAGAAGSGGPSNGAGGAGSFLADAIIGPTAPSYGTPGPVSSTRYFAGGGGGGAGNAPGPTSKTGGTGGGGNGKGNGTAGEAGDTNTGSGGGGTGNNVPSTASGGSGGSGIVILRYKYQN